MRREPLTEKRCLTPLNAVPEEGHQPAGLTIAWLLTGFPVVWAEQWEAIGAQRLDTGERASTSASESAMR